MSRVIALGPPEQRPLDEITSPATLLRHESRTLGTRSHLLEHGGQFRIEGVFRQDERLAGRVRMVLSAGAAISQSCRSGEKSCSILPVAVRWCNISAAHDLETRTDRRH